MQKKCFKCNIIKDILQFPKNKGICKECRKKYNKEWRNENKEYIKKCRKIYYINNKEKIQLSQKKWQESLGEKYKEKERKRSREKYWHDPIKSRKKQKIRDKRYKEKHGNKKVLLAKERRNKNPEKFRQYQRDYKVKNKEKCHNYSVEWRNKNREKIRQYDRKKLKTPNGKLDSIMRGGIRKDLVSRGTSKNNKKWEDLVGYTKEELLKRLISKFTKGMTIEKLINGEIVIDHIIPRVSFIYSSYENEQFKACWSLNNLQPMWHIKNSTKQDILPDGTFGRHNKNGMKFYQEMINNQTKEI
ncbi:MAG: hypothetical protein AABY22_01085 [Nanoarchaeota archaeon]